MGCSQNLPFGRCNTQVLDFLSETQSLSSPARSSQACTFVLINFLCIPACLACAKTRTWLSLLWLESSLGHPCEPLETKRYQRSLFTLTLKSLYLSCMDLLTCSDFVTSCLIIWKILVHCCKSSRC